MTASDGSFNSTVEGVQAQLIISGPAPKARTTVFVRGRDASGNWGAVSAVFHEVIAPVAMPEHAAGAGEVIFICPRTFSPGGTIELYLPHAAAVRCAVVDLSGRTVLPLIADRVLPAGRHEVRMRGQPSTKGLYVVQLDAGSQGRRAHVLLMR
jgi:hypothetical protein